MRKNFKSLKTGVQYRQPRKLNARELEALGMMEKLPVDVIARGVRVMGVGETYEFLRPYHWKQAEIAALVAKIDYQLNGEVAAKTPAYDLSWRKDGTGVVERLK